MIDENKIIEAAIKNADKYNPCRSTLDREEVCRASFEDGAKWFKSALWHDASEEPEIDKPLIIQYISLMNEVSYDKDRRIAKYPWKLNVEGLRIIKWCYFDDLLPKGGEK